MSKSSPISRRTVLRGLGASVALPWLEAMGPALAWARRADDPAHPVRMAFVYLPNGMHMPDWTPQAVGADYAIPHILEPLAGLKDDFLVLTGLTQDKGFAHGDGPGDHARALSTFLTGVHPVKTAGANIKVGVSVDQVAAQKVGRATRLPSLEIGCARGAQSGDCDSGYSCAYSSNISWRSESTPMAKEINPRLVFERLFSHQDGGSNARRDFYRKSILDFVAEDAGSLKGRLGAGDRRKVDEYLTSVRELELRVARAEQDADRDLAIPNNTPKPGGIPKDYPEHVRLMYDMLALAFRGDVTRVATFVLDNEASNRSYPFVGVTSGHHEVSHHAGDPKKHEAIKAINRFHVTELTRFLESLKATREGDGTLLDHAMIVFGSGLGDGNRHNHDDLPILLAGKGGGTIRTGRHVKYDRGTPLNDLYLSMLDRIGAPVDLLGDSKGRLPSLTD